MTSRTKAIVSLSGVFLLGAVIGALVVGIIVRGEVRDRELLKEQAGFEMYIVDRLRLTEAQRDSLKDELERTFAELDELRFNTATEYRALLDTLKQRISPQLTPDQRALLADMDLNFRRGFPGRRHGGPPPHPPLGFRPPPEDRPFMESATPPGSVPGDSAKHSTATTTPKDEKPKDLSSSTKEPPKEIASKDTISEESNNRLNGLVNSLDKVLVFTPSQRQQVETVVQETIDRQARARKELAGDPLRRRITVKQNLRDMNSRIEAVLTPEQLAKYQRLTVKR